MADSEKQVKEYVVVRQGWVLKKGGAPEGDTDPFGVLFHLGKRDIKHPKAKIPDNHMMWAPNDAKWVLVSEDTYNRIKNAGKDGLFIPWV